MASEEIIPLPCKCQWCRNRGGQGGHWPPQYFADQLTLFEPGRADYPHLLLLAPPMFFTFRHHCPLITYLGLTHIPNSDTYYNLNSLVQLADLKAVVIPKKGSCRNKCYYLLGPTFLLCALINSIFFYHISGCRLCFGSCNGKNGKVYPY